MIRRRKLARFSRVGRGNAARDRRVAGAVRQLRRADDQLNHGWQEWVEEGRQ